MPRGTLLAGHEFRIQNITACLLPVLIPDNSLAGLTEVLVAQVKQVSATDTVKPDETAKADEVTVEISATPVDVETSDAAIELSATPVDVEKLDAEIERVVSAAAKAEVQKEFQSLLKHDGGVDKGLFIQTMQNEYNFDPAESEILWKKWDVDEDGLISEEEYEALTGVMREARLQAIQKTESANTGKGCCGTCLVMCGAYCFVIAVLFACCTLGISLLIWCLFCAAPTALGAATLSSMDQPQADLYEAGRQRALRGPSASEKARLSHE